MSEIYNKTAVGVDEISTRARGLPSRSRSILILVDGRSSRDDLLQRVRSLGYPDAILDELVSGGYVERKAFATAAGLTARPASASATRPIIDSAHQPSKPAAVAARRSLAIARMYLQEVMGRFLGKDSDALRNGLRSATSREEIVQRLDECMLIVAARAGPERADDLRAKTMALLPD